MNSADDLPKQMCFECLTVCQAFNKFLIKSNESNITLIKILSERVKDNNSSASDDYDDDDAADDKIQSTSDIVSKTNYDNSSKSITSYQVLNENEFMEVFEIKEEENQTEKHSDDISVLDYDKDHGSKIDDELDSSNIAEEHSKTKDDYDDDDEIHSHITVNKGKTLRLCPICGFQSRHMHSHMTTHRITAPPYECKVCGKKFRHSATLKVHSHQHTGEKPYKCDLCDKAFTDNTSLRFHKNSKIHLNSKNYLCTICNKSYQRSDSLIRHRLSHTQERRYPCTECDSAFFTRAVLKKHIAIHSGIRPFQCELCPKDFIRAYDLKVHKMRIHLKDQKSIPER